MMRPPCAVESPSLAAGSPPIMTVADPFMMVSGGPAQVSMSPMVAAGKPPIRTVVVPGGRIGPPTWGTSPVTIGQTCISVIRAAGGIIKILVDVYDRALYDSLTAALQLCHRIGLGAELGVRFIADVQGL